MCLAETAGYSDICHSCERKSVRKVQRPSKEELIKMIKTIPMTKLGKQFGVSDNTIRKWCRQEGIETKRGRGYWN